MPVDKEPISKRRGVSNKTYSNEYETIYVNSIDFSAIKSQQGNYYGITTGAQSVVANGFLVVQLTNPANSGKTINISSIRGGATVNTTLDVFKNATFAAAGTPLTPRNRNWAFADASAVTGKWLTQGTDPTTGGTLLASMIQTGGSVDVSYEGRIIIPSATTDRQFYIRLTNNVNQANTLAVTIAWWET